MTEVFPVSGGDARRRTWVLAIPVLVVVFTLGGQLTLLIPLNQLGWITRDNVETYPQILFLLFGAFGMALLFCLAWVRFFEGQSLASIGLTFDRHTLRGYLRGCGLGLLMASATVYSVALLGGYVVEASVQVSLDAAIPIGILLLAFMVQAGTEEVIFRGWMLDRLAARYGLWSGILGNGALFTAMHIDSTEGLDAFGFALFVVSTMLFAVFLSQLAIREKSIWGAAAWHAVWNWMFITCFGLPTTGIDLHLTPLISDLMPTAGAADWLTGGKDGPEGSVLVLVVLGIGVVWLALARQRDGAFNSD